jgi:glycosyltransferase involved in cell wall biosynthesis
VLEASLNVLLLTHRLPPEGFTGVERYVEGLATCLSSAGDEVTVVTGSRGAGEDVPAASRGRLACGAQVYRLAAEEPPPERFLRWHRELESLFEPVLDRAAPDVVHVNHLLFLSPRFVPMAHERGAAVVVTLHDYYFECALYRLLTRAGERCPGPGGGRSCAAKCFATDGERALERWRARTQYFERLLASADRVHVPSRHMSERARCLLDDPGRLRCVELGVRDRAGPRPLPPAPGQPLRLAFVGKGAPAKGVHVVLEALAQARLDEVDLRIVGDLKDAYARRLEQVARGIPGLRLELTGRYEPEELAGRLDHVDCVVVPSLWEETFSLVTREALALGVPVVVSRLGALPEAVRAGKNGLVFDPERPAELTAIAVRLAADESLRRRLRAGAAATSHVDMTKHTGEMRSLYADAIAARVGGGAPAELEPAFSRLVELGFS